jgi:hypothetical protein
MLGRDEINAAISAGRDAVTPFHRAGNPCTAPGRGP